jgi:hypothetical protein
LGSLKKSSLFKEFGPLEKFGPLEEFDPLSEFSLSTQPSSTLFCQNVSTKLEKKYNKRKK